MKSPFPGMDPYLECHWGDVHQALCTYARDQLQEQLGNDLLARLGERLVVESLDKPRSIYPDVRVVQHSTLDGSAAESTTAVMEEDEEPLILQVDELETQAYIEITEADSSRLITVIEFLSPSNKYPGEGRDQYKRKQSELKNADVNLVEIDLTRSGPRVFMLSADQMPVQVTYAACVFRASTRISRELYEMPLRRRLRNIRVPLRTGEADVALRLQPLIEMAYRNGRCDRTDYGSPCVPPLEGDDKQAAEEIFRLAGRG